MLFALKSFTDQCAVYGLLILRPPLLGAGFAAWLRGIGLTSFAPLSLFLLLYPDGRLPSCHWRPLLILVLFIWVGNVLFGIIKTGPITYYPLRGDTAIRLLAQYHSRPRPGRKPTDRWRLDWTARCLGNYIFGVIGSGNK